MVPERLRRAATAVPSRFSLAAIRSCPSSAPFPSRRLVATLAFLPVLVAVASRPVAAQSWWTSELDPSVAAPLQFGAVLLVNLLVGGLVVAFAPDFAGRMVGRIREDAGGTFLFGLLATVVVVVAAIALAITVIGVVVLIPGLFVLAVAQAVGTAVAVVALGSKLTPRGHDGFGVPLLVGSVVVAAVGLVPLLGDLVTFVVTTVGFGAVTGAYWEDRQARKRGSSGQPA